MCKIYIVDDEPIAIRSIKNFIENNFISMEIVGTAGDGLTALEEIQQLKPNVVITDVKMPGMDGVELSKRLHIAMPETKIVFISGYGEVDYIRNALAVEAVDYILKPVRIEELKEVLCRIEKKDSAENERKRYINDMEKKLFQSMPLLRQRFFSMLINRYKSGKELYDFNKNAICSRMKFLNIDLPYNGKFIAVALWIRNNEEVFEHNDEAGIQLLSYGIQNIMQEIIERYTQGYAFETEFDEFGAIMVLNDEYEEQLLEFSDELHRELYEALGLETVLGLGDEVDNLREIGYSWMAAKNAITHKNYLGRHFFTFVGGIENGKLRKEEEIFGNIVKCMSECDVHGVNECVELLFNGNEHYTTEQYKSLAIQLLFIGRRFEYEKKYNIDRADAELLQTVQMLLSSYYKEQFESIVGKYLEKICDAGEPDDDIKSLRTISSTVKNIIDERYCEKLTLKNIASEVFLTPTYVCMLFKIDMGITINEYITNVRMMKAKEYLRTTDMKFADIANKIGYSESSYFSKLFKRHEGMLPSEYRQKYR